MSNHLSSCPQCRPLATEWGRILWTMDQISTTEPGLPNEACIDENDMAEYVDGVAGGILRRRVERHLAGCRNCVRRLVSLHDIVQSIDITEVRHGFQLRWLKDGLQVIRESLRNMELASLTPVPQLRGPVDAKRAVACSLQHEGYDITLTTLREEDDDGVACIVNLESGKNAPGPVTVSLSGEHGLLESRTLRDVMTMTFLDLQPDAYCLDVEFPETAVQVEFAIERA